MARNSDIVREGQSGLPHPNQAQANPPPQTPPGEAGTFQSVPGVREQPPLEKMGDFPILSQIHAEVGTMAVVVQQINQITDFIQAFASTGEMPTSLTQQPAPEASPTQAPPQVQAQPQVQQPIQQPQPPAQPPDQPPVEPQPVSEEEVEDIYKELYAFVEMVTYAAQEGRAFNIDQAFVLVPKVVGAPGVLDVLYRRAIYSREEEDHGFASSVVLHSINVAIYTLKIGQGLRYSRDQLIDLGVSSLLHDIGMATLPPDLFTKGQFTQQDIDILHQHPIKGRDMILQLGEDFQWLANVVHQEHEREDGSGYPQALPGDQIHEYAKIIGVADVYAGLTRSRADRRGLLPFEAVKDILQTRKPEFDNRIIRILLNTLSAFPIGSLIKLNSGAIGRVIETDSDSPLRPVIEIEFDPEGRPVHEKRRILLREHPVLHITDTVDPEDLVRQ
ncbi:MAG: HD domain-containing protein [bacterium]|nr:HD domain-containing protein [bacterium]